MAAPTYKNFTQAVLSDTGTVTSPSDTAIGDLVICIVWSQGTNIPTHTIAATFTQVRSHSHDDGTTDGRLSVATKVATVAGAQSYAAFTIAGATAGQTCAAIITVTGANTTNPAGWAQNSTTNTGNQPPDPPSITGLNYDVLTLAIAGWQVTTAGATSATVMTSYTLRVNGPTASHVTHLAVSTRALTALNNATEDPAAYGDNVTPNGTAAMTIAIPMTPVAQTYFVSTAGNDSNNGITTGTSWKTLGPINSKTVLPGDTFKFNGGDTFSGSGLFIQNVASTQASPVTLDSYGTGRATISSPVGSTGCFIYKMGGCVIQNLNFTGPGVATANKDGVSFYNDAAGSVVYPYIRITGCTVTGFVNGIAIGGGSGTSGYSDVRVTNCDCNANSKNGITMYGAWGGTTPSYALGNVYVGNCTTYNNTGIAGATEPTGSGIQLGQVNSGTIEFCTAYGNGASNNFVAGPIGIWCWECTGVTIQSCESYNNLSGGGDGGGFDLDGGCTNCKMQYNYSHGNKGGGFGVFQFDGASPFANNVVRYNISENDIGGGITLWSDPGDSITNTQIYNNTVYNSAGTAFRVLPNTTMSGITVTNNILLTSNQWLIDSQNTAGLTFNKNNYYPMAGTFVIWWGGTQYNSRVAWGQDSGGFQADPMLQNPGGGGTIGDTALLPTMTAYRINSAGSPMINAGAVVSSPGSFDFYGDALFSGAADVGSDEFYSAPASIGQPYCKRIGGIPHMRLTKVHSIW